MKKALIIASVASMIEQFNMNNIKLLQELGYQVDVATNFKNSGNINEKRSCELVKELQVINVNCFQIDFDREILSKNNIKAYKQIKKIINNNNYNLIHMHSPIGGVCGRLAAKKERKKGTKVIYTAHGFHFFKGAPLLNWIIFYPIERYLSKYTDCLITINEEDYNLAKKKFNKCRHIELVHGVGIDEKKFDFEISTEEKHKLRESIGLKDDDFVIIYVAELSKRKNQEMLIKAVNELIDEKHENIKVILPGIDSMNGYYQNIVKKFNIEENIKFLGYRTDIPKLLKISDLYVSTAKQEGLPVNVMEAMTCGLPIVATDCRGNRDLIQDSVNGYSVNINDVKELINKIKLLINSHIEINNIINKYSKKVIQAKMKEIYNSVTKIKVLHLLSTSEFSGAENVACQIINMFSNENEFEMIYCSPDGKIRKELEQKEIRYIPIKKMKYNEIKNVMRNCKPDIIHAHDIRASIFASLFSRYAKIISHIHGNHDNMKVISLKSILYYIFSKKMTKIFWVSKSAMDEYVLKNKLKEKSEILVNVINKEEIYLKAEKDNNEYQYDVIYLGRLSKEKNPLRVYEIMRDLVKKNRNIKCVIVGDGNFKDDLKENIEKDQMKDNILLKGKMENPMKILKHSKVMLMASIYEGTPMCALEALAFGVPIVSTPTDGLVDIITNNYNGFLSYQNEELIENIQNIIADDTYRENLSKNALEKFNEINNINEYKRALMNEYIKKV